MTSSGLHPNRSAASAAYCWTIPSMLQVITEVSAVNAFPSISAMRHASFGQVRGTAALSDQWFTFQPGGPMKHLDVVVPTQLLEDVGILTELFFRNNESVDVLQSFAVRPKVLALVVRVHRRGAFKDLETIRREARSLVRRYRLAPVGLSAADPEGSENVSWVERESSPARHS